MMRFSLSRTAVLLMKVRASHLPEFCFKAVPSFFFGFQMGYSPERAGNEALAEMAAFYPNTAAALIVVNKNGEFAGARVGMTEFPFVVRAQSPNNSVVHVV